MKRLVLLPLLVFVLLIAHLYLAQPRADTEISFAQLLLYELAANLLNLNMFRGLLLYYLRRLQHLVDRSQKGLLAIVAQKHFSYLLQTRDALKVLNLCLLSAQDPLELRCRLDSALVLKLRQEHPHLPLYAHGVVENVSVTSVNLGIACADREKNTQPRRREQRS